MDFTNLLEAKGYTCATEQCAIKNYISEYKSGEVNLEDWQRCDGWDSIKGDDGKTANYRQKLIISILNDSDIPKIYLYSKPPNEEIPVPNKHILDGGHRTRAINDYLCANYGIRLKDNNVYWWALANEEHHRDVAKGQNRILPEILKNKIKNYKLTLTTYENMTEKEARIKFNELNNHRPMTQSEVINSHSSRLVDSFRSLMDLDGIIKIKIGEVDEDETIQDVSNYLESIYDYLEADKVDDFVNMNEESPLFKIFKLYEDENGIKSIYLSKDYFMEAFKLKEKDIEMHGYMKIFTTIFSIIERGHSEVDEFSYCEPKNSLKYIRANDFEILNTQYDEQELSVLWSKFENCILKWILTFFLIRENETYEKWTCCSIAEAVSIYHFINKSTAFVIENGHISEEIIDLIDKCRIYRTASSPLKKVLKKAELESQQNIENTKKNLLKLEEDVGSNIVLWCETFQNNGLGKANLKKRYQILSTILTN